VRQDYEDMRFMIFGERPAFDDMMQTIRHLEAEINAL